MTTAASIYKQDDFGIPLSFWDKGALLLLLSGWPFMADLSAWIVARISTFRLYRFVPTRLGGRGYVERPTLDIAANEPMLERNRAAGAWRNAAMDGSGVRAEFDNFVERRMSE